MDIGTRVTNKLTGTIQQGGLADAQVASLLRLLSATTRADFSPELILRPTYEIFDQHCAMTLARVVEMLTILNCRNWIPTVVCEQIRGLFRYTEKLDQFHVHPDLVIGNLAGILAGVSWWIDQAPDHAPGLAITILEEVTRILVPEILPVNEQQQGHELYFVNAAKGYPVRGCLKVALVDYIRKTAGMMEFIGLLAEMFITVKARHDQMGVYALYVALGLLYYLTSSHSLFLLHAFNLNWTDLHRGAGDFENVFINLAKLVMTFLKRGDGGVEVTT